MEEIKPSEEQPTGLSRRELLKILAAGSGALAAAAFLPGKWVRPVVGSGVLPAHAQSTTELPVIANLNVDFNGPDRKAHKKAADYIAHFDFTDPLSEVSTAALLYAHVDGCGQIINGASIASLSGNAPDPHSGQCYFFFNACTFNGNSEMYLKMKVTGRMSNEISGAIFEIPQG